VTLTIDATSYAGGGTEPRRFAWPGEVRRLPYGGREAGRPDQEDALRTTYDAAVGWAHTYTDDANPLDSTCKNCHADRRGSQRI
jgi:hypothetical protein